MKNKKAIFILLFTLVIIASLIAQVLSALVISGQQVRDSTGDYTRAVNYTGTVDIIATTYTTRENISVGKISRGLLNITLPITGMEKYFDKEEDLILKDGVHIARAMFRPRFPDDGTEESFFRPQQFLSLANYENYDVLHFYYASKDGSFNYDPPYAHGFRFEKDINVKRGWNIVSSKTCSSDTLENWYRKGYVWTFEMFQ
jgi:hypothetical protein